MSQQPEKTPIIDQKGRNGEERKNKDQIEL